MANLDSQIDLKARPLAVTDAGGLAASVLPRLWAPSQILETDFNAGIPMTGLALNGELWRIALVPASAMPDLVFYPIGLRATLFNTDSDIGFPALFELEGLASIEGIFEESVDAPWNYFRFNLDATFEGFDVTGPWEIQTMTIPFPTYPPKLPLADTGGPINTALGALILKVKTFNAVAAVNTTLHVDGRFLAFPRGALQNSGFYVPRLYFAGQ